MLKTALEYLEKYSFSIIPCNKDKKPMVKWEQYQKTRASSEEIKQWWTKWPDANIGIITGSISDLAVVDIDTEEGKDAIQEYISDSVVTPTVNTPKGGQHLYFRYPKDKQLNNNARLIPGCDLRAEGGYVVAPPSYTGNGKTYTWQIPLETGIALLPDRYIAFVFNSIMYSSFSSCINRVSTSCRQMFNAGNRDNDLFHVANCLVKGGAKVEEVTEVLELLAQSCNPPFPEKEIKAKVESALKRAERKEVNLAQEVEEWIRLQNGYITSTDVYNCLQVSTRNDKKNISIILRRLMEKGLIEKYGQRAGQFKVVDRNLTEIDYLNPSSEKLDIAWPFDIQDYIKTLPKNIIIVAGVPNVGKTALLLNLAEMNMEKYKVKYFSSEMGKDEINARLIQFERPLDSWNWKVFERAGNFEDVIDPDAINIIDFLEIYQEHFMIGQWIKNIYDKLNKGIAVIAIQKKPGAVVGVGGNTTLEKARLYLTMDSNTLKIEKGKNWANPLVNPNGLFLNYKLIQGCHFITEKDWHREGEIFEEADEEKITFDTEGGEFEGLTERKYKFYKDKFPKRDVAQEIKKMESWLMANPNKRKKNYERFISNWLSK